MNGDYVTIMRHGDIGESVHFKMRKALEDRKLLTHDFLESMIRFLLTHYAIKNKDFIIEIEYGPKRLMLHLARHLFYG